MQPFCKKQNSAEDFEVGDQVISSLGKKNKGQPIWLQEHQDVAKALKRIPARAQKVLSKQYILNWGTPKVAFLLEKDVFAKIPEDEHEDSIEFKVNKDTCVLHCKDPLSSPDPKEPAPADGIELSQPVEKVSKTESNGAGVDTGDVEMGGLGGAAPQTEATTAPKPKANPFAAVLQSRLKR